MAREMRRPENPPGLQICAPGAVRWGFYGRYVSREMRCHGNAFPVDIRGGIPGNSMWDATPPATATAGEFPGILDAQPEHFPGNPPLLPIQVPGQFPGCRVFPGNPRRFPAQRTPRPKKLAPEATKRSPSAILNFLDFATGYYAHMGWVVLAYVCRAFGRNVIHSIGPKARSLA